MLINHYVFRLFVVVAVTDGLMASMAVIFRLKGQE